MLNPDDFAAVRAQLGRDPRSVIEVAHRCSCGQPDVLKTSPRLDDGTPFPTLYYMTCPKATGAIGTLEANPGSSYRCDIQHHHVYHIAEFHDWLK